MNKRVGGAFRLSSQRRYRNPEWWVEDLMMQGKIAMISAQPKAGKSAFCAHLMQAACVGGDFFGRRVPKGEVLNFVGERADQVEDRMLSLFGEDVTDVENFVMVDTEHEDYNYPQLYGSPLVFNNDGDNIDAIIRFIKEDLQATPTVIVVDTLTSFFPDDMDINNPKHMRDFFDGFRRVCKAFDAVGFIIHHDNKEYKDVNGKRSGGGSYNGSVQGLAKVDTWIRATVRKEVPDPDDARGQRKIKITQFEVVMDNFGAGFNERRAVKHLLEDASQYINADEETRLEQEDAMYEVLCNLPHVNESTWRTNTIAAYPQFTNNLGKGTFTKLRGNLQAAGRVSESPDPRNSRWKLFDPAEDA